jgi:hypothetical protein
VEDIIRPGLIMDRNIPELNPPGLRNFALSAAGMLTGVFGVAVPWWFGHAWPVWPWIAAGMLALWGLARPASLRPIYRAWMGLALVLGRMNSVLLLGVVFLLFITPAGVIMRLFGYDPLQRRFPSVMTSCRKPSVDPSPNQMEKPY